MQKPFAAYQGDDPYIFVSYAHEDSDVVYPEIEWLKGQGFNVWFDEGINPGSRWSDELADALKSSSLFLYFASPQSVSSKHCQDEINLALDVDRPTIAVHIQETELTSGLQLRLSAQQAILKHGLTEQEYRNKLVTGIGSQVANANSGSIVNNTAPVEKKKREKKKSSLLGFGLIAGAILAGAVLFYMKPESESQPSIAIPSVAVEAEPSIAILPFTNMSSDPEQEYFSDGIAEEILNSLVKNTRMKVIARTSSFRFRGEGRDIGEIGDTLGVNHVLEGSVRKSGDRIRVTAQLIKVSDGSHIWSERYERVLDDIFAVQDDITGQIVSALSLELEVAQYSVQATDNVVAYNAYMQGLYKLGQSNLEAAALEFERAIDLDPNYLEAYEKLVYARVAIVGVVRGSPSEQWALVRELQEKARQIDPNHPAVQGIDSFVDNSIERNHQRAINGRAVLIRHFPQDLDQLIAYGSMLWSLKQYEASIRVLDRAMELDPLNQRVYWVQGVTLFTAGYPVDARRLFQRLGEIGGPMAVAMISEVALAEGNLTLVAEQLERGLDAYYFPYHYYEQQVVLARSEGRHEEAASYLKQLRAYSENQSFYVKTRFALLEGDLELALSYFEQGIDQSDLGSGYFVHKPPFPHWAKLYDHPEYDRILKKVGLDDESLAKLEIPPLPF